MLTYKQNSETHTSVKLDNKKVGDIVRVAGGYQYRPYKARKIHWGEVMGTIQEVKKSLETED